MAERLAGPIRKLPVNMGMEEGSAVRKGWVRGWMDTWNRVGLQDSKNLSLGS